MNEQTTSIAEFNCDWCGEKDIRVRFVAYGEKTCGHCAPYAHAAMIHPEYADANRRLASYRRSWRIAHFG